MVKRIYDLGDRLFEYTCQMIDIVELLPWSRIGEYLANQLIRSCHSPAFNYAEAEAAESRKDFIHKLSIVLKELKECRIGLRIIKCKRLVSPPERVNLLYQETCELISIIAKSIATAKANA